MKKEDKEIGTDIMDRREIVNVSEANNTLFSPVPGPPSSSHFLVPLVFFIS